ncbi:MULTISPECIES: alpha/beta hydrolase [Rhodococcus]|uniref:Alpha/beta hydrolase n=1 Tax=Rhodococcus rhodochrous TaxID=1829 RepID=A0AAW4XEU9_RHORH|nr:alpha/beta fold hydrolase [Rhodococcus rhodochrous]MCD2111953.1 alpha/beta hydrolase [Rhodococcus rhodochrous]QHG84473.1 alpha/beta fold hydrolase [Rhodococcus rhodochrous]QOH55789.1 hydrolase [Rhodococcus rhodochrous]
MPLTFFPGSVGRVHWRSWPVEDARAAVVFAHGFGQHTGHYHRFASGLAAHGIALWGLDLAGHGLSEGELGSPGDVGRHAEDFGVLAGIAAESGLPLVAMGHSLGAATVLTALASGASSGTRFAGVVLCGTPRTAALPATAEALRTSDLPVLLVHGVDDRLAPIDPVRDWAAAVPRAQLLDYPDAGHDLLHEPVHRRVTSDVAGFVGGLAV